ncbi:MAG: formylglycine-generating enzyme family protein [Candidatus Parabeggiatoa sp. nov. 1]|nr:MAG: formylglycine-generating enzyme family protein [Gammaproteobacteria bacterium]
MKGTIVVISLIVAIIAVLAEIATPELRCWFGLDVCSDASHSQVFSEKSPPKAQERLTSTLWLSDNVFRDHLPNGHLGPEMNIIPEGSFQMGDSQGGDLDTKEEPAHWVNLNSFAIGKYEVTVADFKPFIKDTGYKTQAEKSGECVGGVGDDSGRNWRNPRFEQSDNHPVICVSWQDANAYTHWLSQQTGKSYRLPSEAEWEYAARGDTTTQYWWGNKMAVNLANCDDCGSEWEAKSTAPVGFFKPNPFGLYDTVGNVWEWVADPWHDNYQNAPSDSRIWKKGTKDNNHRVLRGGSWYHSSSSSRAVSRRSDFLTARSDDIGFRVAVSLAWHH